MLSEKKNVVERKFQRTSRTMGYYRFVDGWHIQVSHHTSHPMCPATESFSLGQMRKRGTNYHFQGTLDILAGNILCVYNCICQWYDTEKWYLRRESLKIDLDPEQLTIIKQRERNTSQVRGDCASRNTDSQSFRKGRICQNVGTWTILYYQRISHEGNKSTPRNSQNSRFQAILNDRVKIGPASGIEVFESAGILGY